MRGLLAADSYLGSLARLPLRLLPPDTRVRILTGPLRGKRWLSSSGTHGCWLGTYERDVQRLLTSLVNAGDTVFDIGANVGFFTLLSSSLVGERGRVFAFEPLPRNIAYLERHLGLNRTTNVVVAEAAIAEATGLALLDEGLNPSMGLLSVRGRPVRVVSLDDLVAQGTLPLPHLMKIDVEGAESLVLRGAKSVLSRARPTVVLSAHGFAQRDACWSLLAEHGYDLSLRRDGRLDGMYEILARHPLGALS